MLKRYLKLEEASEYLSVSESFLKQRKGTIFKENIHFFSPSGEKIVRWDRFKLDEWIQTSSIDVNSDNLVNKLLMIDG